MQTQQRMFDFIEQWKVSGLSQKAWCEQHDFGYSNFHYWYRRYRNQTIDPAASKQASFVQV